MGCVSSILNSIYYAEGAEVGFWTCLWHPKHASGNCSSAINDAQVAGVANDGRREWRRHPPYAACAVTTTKSSACVGLIHRLGDDDAGPCYDAGPCHY